MSELTAAIVGALFGSILAGVITYFINARASHVNNTLALVGEWHSLEMQRCRARAEFILQEAGNDNLLLAMSRAVAELSVSGKQAAAELDQSALSQVAHFFERMEILLRLGHLNRDVAKNSMGFAVRWWSDKLLGSIDVAAQTGDWKRVLTSIKDLNSSIGTNN